MAGKSPIEVMSGKAKEAFARAFGEGRPPGVVRAPGRVELLGGHTDYNEGFVLPMAIEQGTYAAFAPSRERRIRVWAEAGAPGGQTAEFETTGRPGPGSPRWMNYVKGVGAGLQERGIELPGADIALVGDLPLGAGLSSSASLEVAAALSLLHLAGKEIARPELARICQWAEHHYAGCPCGIMDQFVSLLGRRDHALLLDCRTLEYQLVPMDFEDYEFLVVDTGVKHDLAAGEYAARRKQCDEAARLLVRYDPAIKTLRDATPEMVNDHFAQMPREVAARARHVVTENLRVLHASLHLRAGRVAQFGRLLTESHQSLRDNFEVSCKESDALVRIAGGSPEVLGARMTGGGFGGSVIVLVRRAESDRVRALLETEFFREFGRKPAVLRSGPAAGAAVLEEPGK
jgi:galactokinase